MKPDTGFHSHSDTTGSPDDTGFTLHTSVRLVLGEWHMLGPRNPSAPCSSRASTGAKTQWSGGLDLVLNTQEPTTDMLIFHISVCSPKSVGVLLVFLI